MARTATLATAVCLALIGFGPAATAHEQTATITIRSNGTYTAPGSWSCSTEGNVDYTTVFCTPSEIPSGQSKWCGEKDVSMRTQGRPATTGSLEISAWCTTGGGANAECSVSLGSTSCTDSEPAHPEFLLWGNQVACKVLHSGVDARWMGRCTVTVGHSAQTTPDIQFVFDESQDRTTVVSTPVDREWVYLGLASDLDGVRCQLNGAAMSTSQCHAGPHPAHYPAHYEHGVEIQAGDFLSFCATPGSAASGVPVKISLQWNPTETVLVTFLYQSMVDCA